MGDITMKIYFKTFPRKIDIYLKNQNGFWQYECSTNAAKTCKQAKYNFCIRHGFDNTQVKCIFAKQ